MSKCIICDGSAEGRQAQEWGRTYDGLDVDCKKCGLLRISSMKVRLLEENPEEKKRLVKILQNRTFAEKKKRFVIST